MFVPISFGDRYDAQRQSAMSLFPPPWSVGHRVWTESGCTGEGSSEGAGLAIGPRQGGVISVISTPYHKTDRLLYTISWDSGQTTRQYAAKLLCIGRFSDVDQFVAAIAITGSVDLTVGPRSGFRYAFVHLAYDGLEQISDIRDRILWIDHIEPLVKSAGVAVHKTKLKAGEY